MMTEKSKIAERLLRMTLQSMVAEPAQLSVTVRPFKGAAYFTVTPEPNDYGKVVGKGGSHAKALEFLLYKMGLVNSEVYGIYIPELDRDRERVLTARKKVEDYDEQPAQNLLSEWLQNLDVKATVRSMFRQERREWKFVVSPASLQDTNSLIIPDPADPQERTVIGQLGTLWRALGNNGGVSIVLEVG